MAKPPRRQKLPSVVDPSADGGARGVPRGTRQEAYERILESRQSAGVSHGALGMQQFGKSFHMRDVLARLLADDVAELGLVHDVKRPEPQFEGAIRRNVGDFWARPLTPTDPPTVVFHPGGAIDLESDDLCDPPVSSVVKLAFQLRQEGKISSVAVLLDELYFAVKGGSAYWEHPVIGKLFSQGVSQGITNLWTTQVPQGIPKEARDLTESYALFHLERMALSHAVDLFRLPREAEGLLQRLETGEFLLIAAGGWDGKIYGPE